MTAKKLFRPAILPPNRQANDNGEAALEFYDLRRKWAEYVLLMSDLSDSAFRVGFWLSRRMNGDDRCCWYSVAGIAERVGKKPRAVRYALAELQSRNVLIVVSEKGRPNCYFLHAPFFPTPAKFCIPTPAK